MPDDRGHRGRRSGPATIDEIPLWVCEKVAHADLGSTAKRRDRFGPDPQLAPRQRAELLDYVGSGYDRGHAHSAHVPKPSIAGFMPR